MNELFDCAYEIQFVIPSTSHLYFLEVAMATINMEYINFHFYFRNKKPKVEIEVKTSL